MNTLIPATRIRLANDAAPRPDAAYVLYWLLANRRTRFNFALERAVQHCRCFAKPLLVLEAVRLDYPWASRRMHRFLLDGMTHTAEVFERFGVLHYRFVEREQGQARGLLEALARDAVLVVSDDAPHFFFPHAIEAASKRLEVPLELVDDCGILPLSAAPRAFSTAYAFRRFWQGVAAHHLFDSGAEEPLEALPKLDAPVLDANLLHRWPCVPRAQLSEPSLLDALDLAQPEPVLQRGGASQAMAMMTRFVEQRLANYLDAAQHPDDDACSGLSPFLHFGQLSSRELLWQVLKREGWQAQRANIPGRGQREGWWGMSASAEAFVDQLLTWRELGFNQAAQDCANWQRFESIPAWAQRTLQAHAGDQRNIISLENLRDGASPDPLWNACQRQLRREGRIHNALRMLWGKRLLEWCATPKEAFELMEAFNNRYALDGRDPNSYTGLLWVFGKFDRAWGPVRPIFGTVRYMSSASTARKRRVKQYLRRFAE